MSCCIIIDNCCCNILQTYLWCYVPVLLAYIVDIADEPVDELLCHDVAQVVFLLGYYYAAVFEQQYYVPAVVMRPTG